MPVRQPQRGEQDRQIHRPSRATSCARAVPPAPHRVRQRKTGKRPTGSPPVVRHRRRGDRAEVFRRQVIGKVEGEKSLVAPCGCALDQQLQPPGFGQVDARRSGHDEQVRFGEVRRSGGRGAAQPSVHPIAEAYTLIALQQFEPIEDTAADVARSLEGIGPVGKHGDRLLIRAHVTLQLRVAGIPQQAAADRRYAHRGDMQVDEVLRRVVQFRPRSRIQMAITGEGVGNLAHRQVQSPHRSIGNQCRPVLDGVTCRIDRADGFDRPLLGSAAQFQFPRDARGRSHDAVADDHDGDGGAADDVNRRASTDRRYLSGVTPDIAIDEPRDALRRDADQHDRLVMFDQSGAGDPAVDVEAHQDVDWLSGIADGADDIGVQVDVPDALLARISGRDRR